MSHGVLENSQAHRVFHDPFNTVRSNFSVRSFSPAWKNYTSNLKLSCPEGDLDEIFFQKSLPLGCFEAKSK